MRSFRGNTTRVKPAPVKATLIVFDATTHRNVQPFPSTRHPKPIASPAPKPAPAPSTDDLLTREDFQRIDDRRSDALAVALTQMPHAEAIEAAADAAESLANRLKAYRHVESMHHAKMRRIWGESQARHDDAQWWASVSNANARDYAVIGESDERLEYRAACSLAQARMDSGFGPC